MSGFTCRSCGAPIQWERTPKGKAIPLDIGHHPNGNIAIVNGFAVVLTRNAASALPETSLRLMPHHATCPNWPGRV